MGFEDWFQLKVINRSDRTLVAKNLYIHWMKLYEFPAKGHEVGLDTVNGNEIHHGETFSSAKCSDENSAAGTEGDLELFDGDKGAEDPLELPKFSY